MNRNRLGQFLIGGVFAACAAVIAALVDLVAEEGERQKNARRPLEETHYGKSEADGHEG